MAIATKSLSSVLMLLDMKKLVNALSSLVNHVSINRKGGLIKKSRVQLYLGTVPY